jgi:hypothetical protein
VKTGRKSERTNRDGDKKNERRSMDERMLDKGRNKEKMYHRERGLVR